MGRSPVSGYEPRLDQQRRVPGTVPAHIRRGRAPSDFCAAEAEEA